MRYSLIVISVLLAANATAQNIPNGDFESWKMRDHHKLSGWFSPTRNVGRSTDAVFGEYALMLSNTSTVGVNGTRGYARSIDYNNLDKVNGLAIQADALSISFWSKYNLADGDTARFQAVLREKGIYRGNIDFRFSGSSNGEYVKFTIPILWNTNGARQIDTVWFYLTSCVNTKVSGDGFVLFDDIQFENIGKQVGSFYNQDFEKWYNTGVEYPEFWRSRDLLNYDSYAYLLPDSASRKVIDTNPKINTSLLIKNYKEGNAIRNGYCFIGTENFHSYRKAFAVKDSFNYLQGYYKFLPDGPDTARFMYRTWSGARTSSYDELLISEPAEEWTFFTIPVNYYRDEVPDSAALVFWSHKANNANGLNTRLYLDNIELVMEPSPIGLSARSLERSNLTYFPNPTNGLVQLRSNEKYSAGITVDAVGQILELPLHNGVLDMSNLPNGIYFVSLLHVANKHHTTIKILKQ